jgi:Family of unknown function (DUF6311)
MIRGDNREDKELDSTTGDDLSERPDFRKRRSFSWLSLLVGGAAFFVVTGGRILHPGHLSWLLHGDGAMNQLGWMFFRKHAFASTTLRSELALWDANGELRRICRFHSSDGVFLEAVQSLAAAPFSVSRAVDLNLLSITSLFCMAAFCLYLAPRFRPGLWLLLLAIASLVTPILMVMTILIYGATILKHYLIGELKILSGMVIAGATELILLFIMWEAGYFLIFRCWGGRFWLLSSERPDIDRSESKAARKRSELAPHLLAAQPKDSGDYEGFCFLGIGPILLGFVAIGAMLRNGTPAIEWKKLSPLLLVVFACGLLSFSNNIAVRDSVIFHYEIPAVLQRVAEPLRASGIFMWPAYYLLLTVILAAILNAFSPRTALALPIGCLLVQVADSWQAISTRRGEYNAALASRSPQLKSPFWKGVASKYKKIEYVLPQNMANDSYVPLCLFAAAHHLPIGIGHFARVDEEKLKLETQRLINLVFEGRFDPTSLYVFQNQGSWESGILRMRAGDWAGLVDNYFVIARGWNAGSQQKEVDETALAVPKYHLGSELRFDIKGEGPKYLGFGWSDPEATWVWSEGNLATIVLPLDREFESDAILCLDALGLVNEKCPRQTLRPAETGEGQLPSIGTK